MFEDGDKVWLEYNSDLAAAAPFQVFCSSRSDLEPLTMSAAEWKLKRAEYNARGVQGVNPGDTCYVDLRSWGGEYYHSLQLPVGCQYVVECKYVRWTTASKKKIDIRCIDRKSVV